MIGAGEIAGALPFAALVDHLAVALLQPAAAPLRLGVSRGTGRELLVMLAMFDRYAGVKVLTVTADNGSNGLPVIGGLFIFIDARTGETLAIMDAEELTARRTAAVSALATRALAKPDARRLLPLGTGHLAPISPRLMQPSGLSIRSRSGAVRPTRQRGPRPKSRRLPAAKVTIANDLAVAARRADVISAATRSTEPLICGGWVAPSTHVDLVGGYRPDMREIDDEGVRQSAIYVDTIEGALAVAGDLRPPLDKGIIGPDAIRCATIGLYIDGAWVARAEPRSIDVIDPATEQVAGRVAEAGVADVDRAVAAARRAFAIWSITTREERLALLTRIVEEYRRREAISRRRSPSKWAPPTRWLRAARRKAGCRISRPRLRLSPIMSLRNSAVRPVSARKRSGPAG